ncbi:MAG: TIGR02221 family CRISPR-associated protein [Bacillota bacterium]
MAKVLVSPLGAGPIDETVSDRDYYEAKYRFKNGTEYETPFLSAALAQNFQIDKIFIIGTCRSMWEKVYEYFGVRSNCNFDKDYWINLADKVSDSGIHTNKLNEEYLTEVNKVIDSYLAEKNDNDVGGSYCTLIDYGVNEEQLWGNFDVFMKLSEKLKDGDQIYLDITHSFRSIPLFMYLMMDFIQNLNNKNIELVGLYYGMLDVNMELGYTPVVNLQSLFEISKWIRGVYDFTSYGNGYLISNLINDEEIAKRITNVSELVNINYLVNLKKQITKLKESLELDKLKETKVLNYVLPQIKQFLARFEEVNANHKFQLKIAKWYFDNKRYANGYICLVESIFTFLCEIYDLDSNKINNRKLVRSLLASRDIGIKYCRLRYLINLREIYRKTNNVRRNVAHAALVGNKRNFDCDIDNTELYYNKIEKLFSDKKFEQLPTEISIKEMKNYKK